MQNRLTNRRKIQHLSLIDDFNRQALLIEVETSFKSTNHSWELNQLIKRFDKQERIRMDNKLEFIASATREWYKSEYEIEFVYIQPGKPTQNGFLARFNGSLREGALNAISFDTFQ